MTKTSLRAKRHHLPKEQSYTKIKKNIKTITNKNIFFPGKTAEDVDVLRNKLQDTAIRKNFPNMDSYIHSSFDRPELVSVKPVDLLKERGGQGVFADDLIPKETCIGAYTGVRYSSKQYKTYLSSTPGANSDYAMNIRSTIIDASDSGNFTRYINYSDTQSNVEFVETSTKSGPLVSVVASREIKKGEQLLINYNVYDPRAARLFYFLNPQDNDVSSTCFYQSHKKYYVKQGVIPSDLSFLQLEKNDQLTMTSIGFKVLKGQNLALNLPKNRVNYPYLRQEMSDGALIIVDFAKKDIFTPLMIACYIGHFHNVQSLVNNGGHIDQKQSQSGNCPLFFALQGYLENNKEREEFLTIICFLIQNNANILSCDRQDKTFLHKAISVLSYPHFKTVVDAILKNNTINFEQILTYVDEDGFDVILTALKGKHYGIFITLLLTTPDYFKLYESGTKNDIAYHQSIFRSALKDYSPQERITLFRACQDDRLSVLPQFSFDGVSSKGPSFFDTPTVHTKSAPIIECIDLSEEDDSLLNMLADAVSAYEPTF